MNKITPHDIYHVVDPCDEDILPIWKDIPHWNSPGTSRAYMLGQVWEAKPSHVLKVLSMDVDGDGRSKYCWIRLVNGDLILGVFPQGEGYFEVEADAECPA